MELSKKTTILLTPELHARLTRRARAEGMSLGELVRRACERQYGSASTEERLDAVRALARMKLPVASPRRMKEESVPRPEELAR